MSIGNIVTALMCCVLPAVAGVVYEIEVKDHEQSPPKTETLPAATEGKALRTPTLIPGRGGTFQTLVFRPDRGRLGTLSIRDQATVQSYDGTASPDAEPEVVRTIVRNPELSLTDEPRAHAYEVFDAAGVRSHVLWCVRAAELPGGEELAAAFQAVGDFQKQPGVPNELRAQLWVFDVSACDGRIPLGVDSYDARGRLLQSARLRNIRVDDQALVEDLRE